MSDLPHRFMALKKPYFTFIYLASQGVFELKQLSGIRPEYLLERN